MSRWLATGAVIAGLMIAEVTMALPAELGGLRPLGEGSLRWFGFRLYDATLYTQQGQVFDWNRPFALSLRYARDIPSAKIVDISLEEMQRYGMPDNRREAWRSTMQAAFPDVKQGDEIVGAFDGNRVRFWHNGKPTRTLDDPLFGRTFFRIWLDPASRAPALREQLLKSAP
ncbi:MAG: chalcone isomerase family protein [Vogesella sp.]|uniref:chalcone isomerase family protein n=1 Tax=Vogesella sp. TaxID=1904252 RepID=UPI00391C0C3E